MNGQQRWDDLPVQEQEQRVLRSEIHMLIWEAIQKDNPRVAKMIQATIARDLCKVAGACDRERAALEG